MQRSKIISTIFIVVILVLTIQVIRTIKIQQNQALLTTGISEVKTKGDKFAPVHIIEYTDFRCPACAKGASYLKHVMATHPGKIYLQYKHYPIFKIHPLAMKTALYAECAGQQGKFWEMHDKLFTGARGLKHSLSVDGRLRSMAEEVGLDIETLEACMADPDVAKVILADKDQGKARGVSATPTYFVNGKMFVGGKALDKELKIYLEVDKK